MPNPLESPTHYSLLIVSPNANLDSYYIFDQIQVGAVNRASGVLHTAGGKGNNMARAAHILGGHILSLGIVGGYSGQFIAHELEREGIPHELVWTRNETRRSSTLIDQQQVQTTVVLDAGDPVTIEDGQNLIAKTMRHASHASYLVLTGSLPPGLCIDYYAKFIREAAGLSSLKVCLDCSGKVLLQAAEAGAQIIKINAREFASSFLDCAELRLPQVLPVFNRLQKNGLELLIITDGANGAYIYPANQPPFQVRTQVDKLVSAVGAGDTFLAGLLLSLLDGQCLEEATCFASAAAAANLQRVICGSLTLEDVHDYLSRTELTQLVL